MSFNGNLSSPDIDPESKRKYADFCRYYEYQYGEFALAYQQQLQQQQLQQQQEFAAMQAQRSTPITYAP